MFCAKKAGKVGIHIAIKVQRGWLANDEATCASTSEVATKALKSDFMRGPRIGSKASALMIGEGAVEASIGGEIHGHANRRAKVERT